MVPGGTETWTPSMVSVTIFSSLTIPNPFLQKFFTTETQRTQRKKLENWNDGILEEPIVCPPFHYSIVPLFHSFFFFDLCVLCG
jgi:hypothetical protein